MGFINTSAGQVVLAQALLAIGGVMTLKKSDGHPLDALKEGGEQLEDRASHAGEKLTRAFAAAAHAFREVMESDQAELPLANLSSVEPLDDREGSKKKSRARSAPH
jgi:hypothetical protein